MEMQVVVFAAGALGSTLGGLLALKKHDVTLVCRKAHADETGNSKHKPEHLHRLRAHENQQTRVDAQHDVRRALASRPRRRQHSYTSCTESQ